MSTCSENPVHRWGILSTARIAGKFMKYGREAGAEFVAVASRTDEKAKEFAETHGLPYHYGNYEDLLSDSVVNMDAIYIPLPTSMHVEHVLKAAEHGRHVLCDKPLAVSNDEVRQMITACMMNNVALMDGMPFVHNPRTDRLIREIHQGAVGDIRRIQMGFSFCPPDFNEFRASNIRMKPDLEPMGVLGDLGCYCVRVILEVLQYSMLPTEIISTGYRDQATGALTSFHSVLIFPQRDSAPVTAVIDCSFDAVPYQRLTVCGTGGVIDVPDMVNEYECDSNGNEAHPRGIHYQDRRHGEYMAMKVPEVEIWNGYERHQRTHLVQAFHALMDQFRVASVSLRIPYRKLYSRALESFYTQCVMDAIYHGILINAESTRPIRLTIRDKSLHTLSLRTAEIAEHPLVYISAMIRSSKRLAGFVFVRHGNTLPVESTDLARVLSPKGLEQCKTASQWFESQDNLSPYSISSYAGRCVDTCRITRGGEQTPIFLSRSIYEGTETHTLKAMFDDLGYAPLSRYLEAFESARDEFEKYTSAVWREVLEILVCHESTYNVVVQGDMERDTLVAPVYVPIYGHAVYIAALAYSLAKQLNISEQYRAQLTGWNVPEVGVAAVNAESVQIHDVTGDQI